MLQLTTLDLKAAEAGRFTAYAAAFGNVDRQGDVIERGAFRKALAKMRADGGFPALLAGHDQSAFPVGKILSITEDDKGLLIEGELSLETERGKEAWALIKSGALTGMSIGYRAAAGGATEGPNGTRKLSELELFECSLVSVPANPEARILKFKAMTKASDIRAFFCGRGLSRSQADACASAVMKTLGTTPDFDDDAQEKACARLKSTHKFLKL